MTADLCQQLFVLRVALLEIRPPLPVEAAVLDILQRPAYVVFDMLIDNPGTDRHSPEGRGIGNPLQHTGQAVLVDQIRGQLGLVHRLVEGHPRIETLLHHHLDARIGEAHGVLKRHLAPITVGRILWVLSQSPLTGPIMKYGTGQLCIPTSVIAGKEKAVDNVEPGVIVYTPQTSTICIILEQIKPYSPVNKIGHITEGLVFFEKLQTGNSLSIQLCD